MTMHLGIDIGVQAAIAIVDPSGALVEIHDMPVLQDGVHALIVSTVLEWRSIALALCFPEARSTKPAPRRPWRVLCRPYRDRRPRSRGEDAHLRKAIEP
jgi:hypothetical protein